MALSSRCIVTPQHRVCTRSRTRTLVKLQATPTSNAGPVKVVSDPFAEKKVYKDNMFDKLMIKIYTEKMAAKLNGVYVPPVPTYDDFVRVSKEIMRGRSPTDQKRVVLDVLDSLLPPGAPEQFRKLFPPTQTSAELNAGFATAGFGWLVGEMELQKGDIVVGPNGEKRQQRSIVKIKKCRYLEASGCVGMCVNMCKIPTQSFFTEEFGLPLTMKPNFEDLSCEMIFGQAPLPVEKDEAFSQPCFKLQCNVSSEDVSKPCPKLSPPAPSAVFQGRSA
uniref:Beta-carotene isomerase D27-like C-terminal domain-containing protein n=1 Tax=Chlamydomonas leiostraca TaxID=1034604 RepID=A0A7S0R2P5_9CHLO|mmetsp:Transcript_12253/g.29873  ORF Transcript_12253/g.29873 Transcript_12253/m.29873 type:complete len:276 (+) Transcript_12253:56-883(+)